MLFNSLLYNPIFQEPEKEDFVKHCGKRRKWWQPAFSPFPKMFSGQLKASLIYQLSANALNFGKSKFFWCGEELNYYHTTNFKLFQTERVWRWQFWIWWKWQKVIQMGRKHCGKRRNCSLPAISPLPTVFSKGLFPRGVKRCHCVGMG